jgi:glycine amidinotransferase
MTFTGSDAHIVNSHNEWDPLEEVIIGRVENACWASAEPAVKALFSHDDDIFQGDAQHPFLRLLQRMYGRLTGVYSQGSFHGPICALKPGAIEEANEQIENFISILKAQNIIVRRPDIVDFNVPVKTPDFSVSGGNNATCPRDLLVVIGNEIIEAPMSHRSRYFEFRAYRSLMKEYFKAGCKWTAAPKPLMGKELYRENYPLKDADQREEFTRQYKYITTEFEPVFDAADIIRCGKDIFIQHSFTTNLLGIEWLKRHLGPTYRVHTLNFRDINPMHIDATFLPLRPGIILANPARPCENPAIIEFIEKSGWKIYEAPESIHPTPISEACSSWICMNVLSLDEQRIVVEASEIAMIKFLESLKFDVIPCHFTKVYDFGGSFHCVSVDVRRRGSLASYFPYLDNHEEGHASIG